VFSLTYEFKLKPTLEQTAIFTDWLEQCRRVYNYALGERKDWSRSVVVRLTLAHLRLNTLFQQKLNANLCQSMQSINGISKN
jgi:transposase